MKTTATHSAIQTTSTGYLVVEREKENMGLIIGHGTMNECYKMVKKILPTK